MRSPPGSSGAASADCMRSSTSGRGVAQGGEVVTALQEERDLAAGVLAGQLHHRAGHDAEAPFGDPHGRQRVVAVRVEAGRYQQPVGLVALDGRDDDLPEHRQVLGVAAARRQRHVHRVPLSLAAAHLVRGPGSGIVGVLVRGQEEHRGIVVEGVLRAVAVVHVPVHDRHPARAVGLLEVPGADGHRVEQAEPHAPVPQRVMSRRPHHGEAVGVFGRGHRVQQLQEPSHRHQRHAEGVAAGDGVPVQREPVVPGGGADQVDVGRAVAQLQLLLDRGAQRQKLVGAAALHDLAGEIEEGLETLRALGMIRAGLVLQEHRIGHDGGTGHVPRNVPPCRTRSQRTAVALRREPPARFDSPRQMP